MLEKVRNFLQKNYEVIICVLVVVLLLILFYSIYNRSKTYIKFCEGLWRADDEFCDQSQIDGLLIFIGSPTDSFGRSDSHLAYIIMHSGDNIIISKKFKITFQRPLFNYLNPFNYTEATYNVYLQDEDGELEKVMPLAQSAKISLTDGRMIWSGEDDIVYANLYKDALATKYAIPDDFEN